MEVCWVGLALQVKSFQAVLVYGEDEGGWTDRRLSILVGNGCLHGRVEVAVLNETSPHREQSVLLGSYATKMH